MRLVLLVCAIVCFGNGCGLVTDAATRLAYDIEAGTRRLPDQDGARYRIEHQTPSHRSQCVGPYTVQLDEVGAIIIWCRDDSGATVSSHSTSAHRHFADTPRTYLLDKAAGETLLIELERRNGRAVIVDVR